MTTFDPKAVADYAESILSANGGVAAKLIASGRIRLAAGDVIGAHEVFDAAVPAGSDGLLEFQVGQARSAFFFESGFWRDAFLSACAALELAKGDAPLVRELGIAAYERVVLSEPQARHSLSENSAAHFVIGIAHRRRAFAMPLGEKRELELRVALEELSSAIAKAPRTPEYFRERSVAYFLVRDRIRSALDRDRASRLEFERSEIRMM